MRNMQTSGHPTLTSKTAFPPPPSPPLLFSPQGSNPHMAIPLPPPIREWCAPLQTRDQLPRFDTHHSSSQRPGGLARAPARTLRSGLRPAAADWRSSANGRSPARTVALVGEGERSHFDASTTRTTSHSSAHERELVGGGEWPDRVPTHSRTDPGITRLVKGGTLRLSAMSVRRRLRHGG